MVIRMAKYSRYGLSYSQKSNGCLLSKPGRGTAILSHFLNKDDFILRILKSTFILDTRFNFSPCFKKTYNSYSRNYAEGC